MIYTNFVKNGWNDSSDNANKLEDKTDFLTFAVLLFYTLRGNDKHKMYVGTL